MLVRHEIAAGLRRAPGWALPATIVAGGAVIALLVALAIFAERAESVDRLLALDTTQDLRRRGLPVAIDMIRHYFPGGAGIGGFDPLFRLAEPLTLLKPTYFNHAHYDFLEVVLHAGLAGVLLFFAAVAWWVWFSVKDWRSRSALPQLGSAILFLVFVASLFDYPARTPMIMAISVIAAIWLCVERLRPDLRSD